MLPHLNLAGDGDEIDAIEDVEEAFGVPLDTTIAETWRTAGDVFGALLSVLPRAIAEDPATWERFRIALCRESGDTPEQVGRETLLIMPADYGLLAQIRRLFSR